MPISAPSRIHLVPIVDKVNIFWNDPDRVESKRYVIQRSPNAQGAFATIHTKNPVTTTHGLISQQRSVDREYADIGLAPGTYDYRIRSEANGEFMVSNVFTVVVGGGIDYNVVQGGQDVAGRNGSVSQPWGSLAYAMSRVSEGQQHRINFTGDFDTTNTQIALKRGVSIRGTGENNSIVRFYRNVQYDEGISAFFYQGNGTTTNLNAEYSDFWVDGGNKQGRHAFVIRDARGYRFSNMKVTKTFMAGIQPRGIGEFFSIVGGTIDGCGYTPPKQAGDTWPDEGGTFHAGGIWLKGSFNDFTIRNVNAIYMEGYWLKISPSYERLAIPGDYSDPRDKCVESIVHSITGVGGLRSWAGTQAPEFPLEIWLMDSERMLFHNMNMQNQFSLEHKNRERPSGTYSIAIWDSYIRANKAAAVELSNSDTSVDNCFMDFRSSVGFDEAMGDFNQKPNNAGASDITISRSLFLMGNSQSPFISSRNRYTNLRVLNCGISYTGGIAPGTLLNMVRLNNNNNTDWPGLQIRNTWISVEANGGSMQLIRRTGSNTVGNDGDGIPAMTNAQFTHITTNRILGAYPTGGVTINNIVNAVPQLAGGIDARLAFRPLDAGNLINTGVQIGLPFSGSNPDRGWFETGLSGGAGNQLPQVTVLALPAQILQGANINVSYSVSDSDGTIGTTELLVNGISVQTDSLAPFATYTITAPAVGTYQIAVRVTDNLGGITTGSVQTTVVRGANTNPTITLGSLSSQYPTGSTITLSATVADADGLVSRVEFFSNNVKIGERITAPYVFNYAPPTNGAYAFKAIVIDNDNATAESAVANVTVITLQEVFSWGMNLGGRSQLLQAPELIVDNKKFEAYDPLALKSGVAWDYPVDPVLIPNVAGTKNQLLRTSVSSNPTTPVSLEFPRPNALYNAYVYVMEDNALDPFDLMVQGIKVVDNHIINGIGTIGQWQMLGPFTANVTDGIFRVTGLDGSVNIAAVELRSLGSQIQVALSQPANVVAGQSLTLTANVTLVPGQSVTKVEFYNGTVKLGEDLASPYSYLWAGLVAGTYQLTARVIDSNGFTINSQPVELVVSPANQVPSVAFLTNTNLNLFEGSAVEINGTASDDKALSKIELFNGTVRVGEALGNINDPNSLKTWTFVVTGLAVGSYTFTAKATDADGLSTVSVPIILVVRKPVIRNRKDKYSYSVQSPDYILVLFKKYVGLS